MVALKSLAPALVRVSRAALALHVRGFNAACGPFLEARREAPAVNRAPVSEMARSYRHTAILPWSNCLTRSVALCRDLRRRGLPAIVRIGTARGHRVLKAHAWVELDGLVVNDSATIATAFAPLPAPGQSRL